MALTLSDAGACGQVPRGRGSRGSVGRRTLEHRVRLKTHLDETKPPSVLSVRTSGSRIGRSLSVGTEIGLVEKLAAMPHGVLTVSGRVQAAAWRRDESGVLEVLA